MRTMTQGDENAELAKVLREQEARREERRHVRQRSLLALAILAGLVIVVVAWTLVQGDLAGQG